MILKQTNVQYIPPVLVAITSVSIIRVSVLTVF